MPDPKPLILPPLRRMAGESIQAAAIRHEGKVWSVPPPGRHHDVIRLIAEARPETLPVKGGIAQGFVTSKGRFVTRTLAGKIALSAGQTVALRWGPHLYSEDLW